MIPLYSVCFNKYTDSGANTKNLHSQILTVELKDLDHNNK